MCFPVTVIYRSLREDNLLPMVSSLTDWYKVGRSWRMEYAVLWSASLFFISMCAWAKIVRSKFPLQAQPLVCGHFCEWAAWQMSSALRISWWMHVFCHFHSKITVYNWNISQLSVSQDGAHYAKLYHLRPRKAQLQRPLSLIVRVKKYIFCLKSSHNFTAFLQHIVPDCFCWTRQPAVPPRVCTLTHLHHE